MTKVTEFTGGRAIVHFIRVFREIIIGVHFNFSMLSLTSIGIISIIEHITNLMFLMD